MCDLPEHKTTLHLKCQVPLSLTCHAPATKNSAKHLIIAGQYQLNTKNNNMSPYISLYLIKAQHISFIKQILKTSSCSLHDTHLFHESFISSASQFDLLLVDHNPPKQD